MLVHSTVRVLTAFNTDPRVHVKLPQALMSLEVDILLEEYMSDTFVTTVRTSVLLRHS